jgi:hypothetical protein
MSDYKSDKITGKQRARSVTISNPDGGVPTISYQEELSVIADGLNFRHDVGTIGCDMSDPTIEFPMLNPADNSVIGFIATICSLSSREMLLSQWNRMP